MMYCPECKTKYKKDFIKCPYCDSTMTNVPLDVEFDKQKLFNSKKNNENDAVNNKFSYQSFAKKDDFKDILNDSDENLNNSAYNSKDFGRNTNSTTINPTFLTELSEQYMVDLICNMLKENKIPYFLKQRGLGAYNKVTMGSSIYGSEIYVDKASFDKAREILETVTSPYKEPLDSDFEESYDKPTSESSDMHADFTPLKESDNRTYFIGKTIIRFFIILFGLISAILIIVSFVMSLSNKPSTYTTTYSRTISSSANTGSTN